MTDTLMPTNDIPIGGPPTPAEVAMQQGGEPTHMTVPEDYFGFGVEHRVTLPDGISWVEHKELNEGERRNYLNSTNRSVTIRRQTGDAQMQMAPGDERFFLLKAALVGWNLKRGGADVPFTKRNLEEFLDKANPRIIDLIEKDVRKHNPWLLNEMSLDDIDKEIANLQEMRDAKVKEEEGKSSSGVK